MHEEGFYGRSVLEKGFVGTTPELPNLSIDFVPSASRNGKRER